MMLSTRQILQLKGPTLKRGDRYFLRNKKAVPFSIIVTPEQFDRSKTFYNFMGQRLCKPIISEQAAVLAEKWDRLNTWQKSRLLEQLFFRLNANLHDLSGNRFGLKLVDISFPDRLPENYIDNGGFQMVVWHSHSKMCGCYCGDGRFTISPSGGLFWDYDGRPHTGLALHEMMHGFFGIEDHNDELDGTGATIFSSSWQGRAVMHEREADFLGWPKGVETKTTIRYGFLMSALIRVIFNQRFNLPKCADKYIEEGINPYSPKTKSERACSLVFFMEK